MHTHIYACQVCEVAVWYEARLPQLTFLRELCFTNESENEPYEASTRSPAVRCHKCKTAFLQRVSPRLPVPAHADTHTTKTDSSSRTGSWKHRLQQNKTKSQTTWLDLYENLWVGCAVCQVRLWQGRGCSDGCGWWWWWWWRGSGGTLGCSPPSCQPPLSARRAGCVGRPGSSVADASPHVRGRQWPDGVPLVLIPHWAISPSRWRAAAGAPLPDNYQASPQMEMSVSLTGPGSCHCLCPRPLYLSRALPTLTMCSVTAD